MIRIPLIAVCFALLARTPAAAGQLVAFERPGGSTPPMESLFKDVYGEEVATQFPFPIRSSFPNWNAFQAFQYALGELMTTEGTLSEKIEEFHQAEQIGNSRDQDRFYWTRTTAPQRDLPLGDGSGTTVSPDLWIPDDFPMEGKNLYFPEPSTMDAINAILERQAEAAQQFESDADRDAFFEKTRALELEFLQLVRNEVQNIASAAGDGEVYMMGSGTLPDGSRVPVPLNLDLIRTNMEGLGVEPAGEGGEAGGGGGPSGSEPVVQPVQSAETAQELEDEYAEFTEPSGPEDETERVNREADLGIFRFRVLPGDVTNKGIKSNDPVLSPEYPIGGLNLPAHIPGEE